MILKRECSTCELNFEGICAGHGDLYKYGERITDDTKGCMDWGANLECFSKIKQESPWYIREPYSECAISYNDFIELIEKDEAGIPIQVNIYDAIQKIYGLSLTQLAEILNVTIGVLIRAKNRNTPVKRVTEFSNTLCISKQLFSKVTTADFDELVKSKNQFFSSNAKKSIGTNIPEWKEKLINEIICLFGCSRVLALKIAMISNFKWEISTFIKDLGENEQALIDFLNTSKKEKDYHIISVEYKIDALCMPKLNYKLIKNNL